MLIPERVHPIIYTLVNNKFATLLELKQYDIWDALDLYEICLVSNYNKSVTMEVKK